jgi:hypothetical protein
MRVDVAVMLQYANFSLLLFSILIQRHALYRMAGGMQC